MNPPTFEIATTRSRDVVVLAVRGELDLATVPLLSERLDASEARRVVVDLCRCTFMDSTGLHLLLRHAGREGTFAVACLPTASPHRIMEITGAAAILAIYESRADAVEALLSAASAAA